MRKLSIVFVTMNRKTMLKTAILSCFESDIPSDTMFVIVDNGSSDGTEDEVVPFLKESGYDFLYKKLDTNVGISAGRNIGKQLADSEYSYYLDDDAFISDESKDHFFTESIALLDSDTRIATLTTKVFDETLNIWRESRKSKYYNENKKEVSVFHGNYYFIRNSIPDLDYIPSIKYAYEDLFLSIVIQDKDYYNALNENIYIVHKPAENKWIKGSDTLFEIYVKANAAQLTIKTTLYPKIYRPLIYICFFFRCFKTARLKKHILKRSYRLFKEQTKDLSVDKIKKTTVKTMIKKYGFFQTF